MQNILVTGGAGYIGSHTVKALLANPENRVIVLDDLSTGFADSIPPDIFVKGNSQDITLVESILENENINTIMHFAASTVIADSLHLPLNYYQNNVIGTLRLLQACRTHGIAHFIFSSSAAVYGKTTVEYISEDHPTHPANPYATSKLMSEQIIKDAAKTLGFRYAILRYFNVAGADPEGVLGQRTPKATHLIKTAVQAACGLRPALPIFGNDYPTPDGTCIRDYIHVTDLAAAHVKALSYLAHGGSSVTLNCGYGMGYSVQQVVQAVEEVTHTPLPVVTAPAREGDLAKVVADNTRIRQVLQWKPQFNHLPFIIQTALDFERKINL